jgi:hypothetical protein
MLRHKGGRENGEAIDFGAPNASSTLSTAEENASGHVELRLHSGDVRVGTLPAVGEIAFRSLQQQAKKML